MENAVTELTGCFFSVEEQTDQMWSCVLVLFGEHLSLCVSSSLLTGSWMNEWVSTPGGPVALQK